MSRDRLLRTLLVVASITGPTGAHAQPAGTAANARVPGSAVVTVEGSEYLIRIECRERSRPEAGFSTEPNRVTRAETGGRSNMVALNLRPWPKTDDVLVSLDRYVAWLPVPSSAAGVLTLDLAMSPATVMRDGVPQAVTYDMWTAGDRPPGRDGIRIRANCSERDPSAPAFRKVGGLAR
ncbi:MAG: hypothetical protein AB7U83_17670 [Vicinamibacterales bacterium]